MDAGVKDTLNSTNAVTGKGGTNHGGYVRVTTSDLPQSSRGFMDNEGRTENLGSRFTTLADHTEMECETNKTEEVEGFKPHSNDSMQVHIGGGCCNGKLSGG